MIAELSIDEFETGLLDGDLFDSNEPFVVRNLVSDWPLVKQAKISSENLREYLLDKSIDRAFTVSFAGEDVNGRIGYQSDMKINFRERKLPLKDIFQQMELAEGSLISPLSTLARLT